MKELTDNEKAYLQLAYDKGYRYVATDRYGKTYFYSEKVKKYSAHDMWSEQFNYRYTSSLCDFGTKWEDEAPVKIADLLGIDDVDWSKIEPYTPVWVRDNEEDKWDEVNFLGYDKDSSYPFHTTVCNQWTDDGTYETWKYCRLATQEEIGGGMNGKN